MPRRIGERLSLLWPSPRRIAPSVDEAPCRVAAPLRLEIDARDEERDAIGAHARLFRDRVAKIGLEVELLGGAFDGAARTSLRAAGPVAPHGAGATRVRLELDPHAAIPAQGYELRVSEHGVHARARDHAGLLYASCTLAQMLELFQPATRDAQRAAEWWLPCVSIDDSPDFAHRGVLLDVSRSKIPTQATLFELVDWFASLKINQLQLYTEHTFAYAAHECVWRGASPMTGAEIEALDRHARSREIELVANQQSFGHLHRWLVHDRYRALAEVPEGIEHAFSRAREPYGLCASDPSSLAFLAGLYDELLPHFSSGQFNVGLDETIDIGHGRSAQACRERGAERVYLEFLRGVHGLVSARGKRMQFFGDILAKHPELARELPDDCIVLEWGYDAGHPFDERCAVLAASGREFYVCPGTSSWQSIAGRTANMLANVTEAAKAGHAAGASGYLVTDWGDRGHLQPTSACFPGWCAGAGLAWNASAAAATRARDSLPELLDLHAYFDSAEVIGSVACALGDAHQIGGARSTNGSPLFFLLAFADQPFPHPRIEDLTTEGLERTLTHVQSQRASIDRADVRGPRAEITVDEWRWAADLLAFACRLGSVRLRPDPVAARALARELDPLIEEHRRLWIAQNRAGGLAESAAWLDRARASLSGSRIRV